MNQLKKTPPIQTLFIQKRDLLNSPENEDFDYSPSTVIILEGIYQKDNLYALFMSMHEKSKKCIRRSVSQTVSGSLQNIAEPTMSSMQTSSWHSRLYSTS